MEQNLARRIRSVAPSLMFRMSETAREMERKGIEIIHLDFGQPKFPTPTHVIEAAKKALDAGYTKYTPSAGLLELREAVAERLLEEDGIEVDPKTEIIVTVGAKYGIFLGLLTTIEEGDDVLLIDPSFTATRDAVRLVGGNPILVPLRNYKLVAEDLVERITPQTKMLLLNYPHNPTGWVPSRNELEAVLEVAQEYNLLILSDEVYEKIVFDNLKHHRIMSFPENREKAIMVSSLSKTYSMTGWRIGWVIAKKTLVRKMLMVQQSSLTCATAFAQKGAVAALRGPQDFVRGMVKTYEKRRDLVVSEFDKIGLPCEKSKGTFYVFPGISGLDRSSIQLADIFLEEAKVALIPGAAFGEAWDSHLRLSLTETEENIKKGLENIKVVIENLCARAQRKP